MKKLLSLFAIALFVSLFIMTGCKEDEPDPQPGEAAFTVLKNYMINNAMDLTDLLSAWVIDALPMSEEGGIVDTDNGYTIPGYHVFDIRSADQFNAGHINGAINVPLADVVDMAANYDTKPILVACVTGQTAGHAVMALRLSGYADAKVLKWGMSGWNPAFATPWENNIGDAGLGSPNWIYDAAPAPGSFSDPTWTSSFTSGANILAERVDAMLNNGFKAVGSGDVLTTPGNYQIINFWTNEEYTTFGHYTGAYQIKPISLASDITKAFDPSTASTVYCFTGQTSSMATAWLNVLGYDVQSILFGVNSLNYTGLEAAGKPHWHGAHDYEYVMTK